MRRALGCVIPSPASSRNLGPAFFTIPLLIWYIEVVVEGRGGEKRTATSSAILLIEGKFCYYIGRGGGWVHNHAASYHADLLFHLLQRWQKKDCKCC